MHGLLPYNTTGRVHHQSLARQATILIEDQLRKYAKFKCGLASLVDSRLVPEEGGSEITKVPFLSFKSILYYDYEP